MTSHETKVLTEHGERLAKVEEALYNHVIHQLHMLDTRLWWLAGIIIANAVGMWFIR